MSLWESFSLSHPRRPGVQESLDDDRHAGRKSRLETKVLEFPTHTKLPVLSSEGDMKAWFNTQLLINLTHHINRKEHTILSTDVKNI